jgi:CHAD domain-containing protein
MATNTKELAAAGAAAAGLAAVGGKLAWDKFGSPNGDSKTAYRLRSDEPVPDGMRRIARCQLELAHAELDGASKRKLAGGVHEARKGMKRLRAGVRLSRDAIGKETYKRENTAFRDTGRRLSGARDAEVLLETLEEVEKDCNGKLPEGWAKQLRERLEGERERALGPLREDDAALGAVLAELDTAHTRTATWTFDSEGFEALEPGFKRIHKRGRKAMKRAAAEPSSENFHEWRKRVKDLWHALQVLRPVAPKKMKKLARDAHGLSDLLGDDHDLAELHAYVTAHPDCFEDPAVLPALVAVIDRRRGGLQRKALKRGRKLYGRRPSLST